MQYHDVFAEIHPLRGMVKLDALKKCVFCMFLGPHRAPLPDRAPNVRLYLSFPTELDESECSIPNVTERYGNFRSFRFSWTLPWVVFRKIAISTMLKKIIFGAKNVSGA
uniref:Uncharacterized protein n=1 Tax=Romanomermis culicivorax TaxID=13658 RepID=A0A915IDK4_ROMCU